MTLSDDRATLPAVTTRPTRGERQRVEIQLLRALAVTAVVANHLLPHRIGGGYVGVDVFFVISGYLISSHLLRELERESRLRLGRFWARRARRLLPASLLVLVAAAVGTLLFIPLPMWSMAMRQIGASALYVQNWELAQQAQDYFTSSQSPSPVTHYWSLSVEEQFYLLWPLLMYAAFRLGRRAGMARGAVACVFAVIVAASLAFSVWCTETRPSAAYFITLTRMWELGVGALLALIPTVRRGRHAVALTGWALAIGSVLLFTEQTHVPGWIALLPVLGTAAVILGGDAFVAAPPRLARPALAAGAWIGAISYSLYLWHWPLIVITPYALRHPLSGSDKVAVLVVSVVLAAATWRLVEQPVRNLPRLVGGPLRLTFIPSALAMALVVALAAAGPLSLDRRIARVETAVRAAALGSDPCFGARAVAHRCPHPHRLIYTDSDLLSPSQQPALIGWGAPCLQTTTGTDVIECQFGVPASEATRRVALIGDSHAQHWASAVDALAVKYHWNVVTVLKSSCTATADPRVYARWNPSIAASCRTWDAAAIAKVAADPSIDLVITSALGRSYSLAGVPPAQQLQAQRAGYLRAWHTWTAAGKKVVVIGDVPGLRVGDVPTCVALSHSLTDPCAAPRRVANGVDALLQSARTAHSRSILAVDPTRFFCDRQRCHAVIGGVVAYVDGNHMLGAFALTLAPYLERRMATAGLL